MRSAIVCLLFCLVSQTYLLGQKPQLQLKTDAESYKINPKTLIFSTKDTLSGGQAYSRITSGEMKAIDAKVNPGMSKDDTFWILFNLKNELGHATFYLEIDNAQLDYLQLFEINKEDSLSLLHKTGDRFPFSQRPVLHRNFILPLTFSPSENKYLLLNIDKRASATKFPMEVYHKKLYSQKTTYETIYFGFYFAFLALIVLLALATGLSLKKQVFLWYSLYVAAFGMWLFSREGFTYQFLTSSHPYFNTHFLPATTTVAVICLIAYIQSFFSTRQLIPTFHKVMNGVFIFFCVGIVLWVVFPEEFIDSAPKLFTIRYILTFLVIVFAYTAAIKSLATDRFKAKLFLIGYTLFFIGILSKILGEYGVVNEERFLLDPIMLGFFVEVIALSTAMVSIIFKVIRDRDNLLVSNKELKRSVQRLNDAKEQEGSPYVVLNSKAVVDISKIKYVKSDGHYIDFYLDDRNHPEVDRNKLSTILELLPSHFVQIHRSMVVNLEFVKTIYSNNVLLKCGKELKLSRTYKPHLKNKLNK